MSPIIIVVFVASFIIAFVASFKRWATANACSTGGPHEFGRWQRFGTIYQNRVCSNCGLEEARWCS
jgi:hypothetical protein